jgi:hypothetical protein
MLQDVTMTGRRSDLLPKIGMLIKRLIVASGPDGISQKVLCEQLGIPRMTASRYCNRFERDWEIRVIREGRGAKYIAKSKIVMDPEIGAYVQGRRAYSELIRKRPSVLINTAAVGIDINRLTDLEAGLFYFSNTMGALLTYILLQALSQQNPVLHRQYHRKGPYYMNDRRKDRLVRQWIDGFLSGILASTPHKFRDLIYKITGHYPANFEDRVKLFSGKKPSLCIDDPGVVRLGNEAFRNIYPSISKILDRISTQLPKAIDSQKASLEVFEKSGRSSLNQLLVEEALKNKEKRRGKQAHDHEFKLLDVKAGVKYFECKICSRKKSELTNSIEYA